MLKPPESIWYKDKAKVSLKYPLHACSVSMDTRKDAVYYW